MGFDERIRNAARKNPVRFAAVLGTSCALVYMLTRLPLHPSSFPGSLMSGAAVFLAALVYGLGLRGRGRGGGGGGPPPPPSPPPHPHGTRKIPVPPAIRPGKLRGCSKERARR